MKKLEEMSFDELMNYFHGLLIMRIGDGSSRSAVGLMIQSLLKIGYDRGFKAGRKSRRVPQ